MALAMSGSTKIAVGGLSRPTRPPSSVTSHIPSVSVSVPCAHLQSSSSARQSGISYNSSSSFLGNNLVCKQSQSFVARSSREASPSVSTVSSAEETTYVVELQKPYGLRFYKGDDGATYVEAIAENSPAQLGGLITEGDKVLETSAIFGDDMWPAAEYGRTMYSVKNRIGILTLKMEKKNGFKQPGFSGNKEWKNERNAGNYGDAIREKQIENYIKKVEMEEQREQKLTAGLASYKAGDYEEALVQFETVLGLQPSRKEDAVASYNVACCYSKLGEVEAGLLALEAAMNAGFEDYKTIRADPDLTTLRESEKFKPLLNRYDEPFINENAMKAISSVFGIFGGKK